MLLASACPVKIRRPRFWKLTVLTIAISLVAMTARLPGQEPGAKTPADKVAEEAAEPLPELPAESPKAAAGAESREEQPSAPDAKRKIQAGDKLIVDVISDRPEFILLRPDTKVVISSDGAASLGSHYGAVNLAGRTLADAESAIDALLHRSLTDWVSRARPGIDPKILEHQMPRLNVRVRFVESEPPVLVRTTAETAPSSGPTVSPYLRLLSTSVPEPAPTAIRPGDILLIEVADGLPEAEYPREAVVEPAGTLPLGAYYGRVNVAGKTLIEAETAVVELLKKIVRDPKVQITYSGHSADDTAEAASEQRLRELEREIAELRESIKQLRPAASAPSPVPTREQINRRR